MFAAVLIGLMVSEGWHPLLIALVGVVSLIVAYTIGWLFFVGSGEDHD